MKVNLEVYSQSGLQIFQNALKFAARMGHGYLGSEHLLWALAKEGGRSALLLKQYGLDDIVRQAVRKYAPLFIAGKISLDIEDTGFTVNTDEKWLCFVIEQILSNSLKYTKAGKISIFSEAPATLVIRDTGIGIAAEDIPRLPEKGFTGYNGRLGKKSTGIGLYLCNEILSRLHHSMEIRSEVGVGTTVLLHLETEELTVE